MVKKKVSKKEDKKRINQSVIRILGWVTLIVYILCMYYIMGMKWVEIKWMVGLIILAIVGLSIVNYMIKVPRLTWLYITMMYVLGVMSTITYQKDAIFEMIGGVGYMLMIFSILLFMLPLSMVLKQDKVNENGRIKKNKK